MGPIVIVGASLAGLRAAQAVRAAGHDGEVVVVGEEAQMPYTRPPLSKELLAGAHDADRCAFDCSVVEVTWRTGERATALDVEAGRVTLASGEQLAYERLIVATGCRARTWYGPGADLDGLFTLRDIDDAIRLRAALRDGASLVVAGAGFVGCEVAATARKLGAEVTLVDVADYPIAPVGELAGRRCAELHGANGVDVRLGAGIAAFAGSGQLEAVELADGDRIEADVAVVALGAIPNTDWLAGSGLANDAGGVRCDSTLTAIGAPDVLCAGDVCSWPHPLAGGEHVRVEHWTNAAEQGAAAGRNAVLPASDRNAYDAVPYFWTDQYHVKLQSAGFPARAQEVQVLEEDAELFVAVGERDGRAVSAVAWNAPRRLMLYRRALAAQPTVDELREQLAGTDKALGQQVPAPNSGRTGG